MKKVSVVFILLFSISQLLFAQTAKQAFKKLSCPEKRWVIFHPFIAKKAFRLTQEAREASKEMAADSSLDHDENGGQVDAFRHAYWMALLSQHFCWRKARNLGKAHEKGNYIDFKKGRTEEGLLTDSVSSQMDLFNNEMGVAIGRLNKNSSAEELKKVVRDSVLTGKMVKLSKNSIGEALDCNGNLIDTFKYDRQWNIPKCFVKSDFKKE